MNEKEQAIFDIIMKHMRINGSEYCSTSEFESDVEDAAKEIAAQQGVQPTVLTHAPNCALVQSLVADCNCHLAKSHSG